MILICDDEKNIRRTLAMVLEGEDYGVKLAATGNEALLMLTQARHEPIEVVLLDVMLPDTSGIDVLRRFKETDDNLTEVIMISGHASLQDAVEATRLGAFDFLEKPIDRERLLITVRNALERRDLKLKVQEFSEDPDVPILGDSAEMRQTMAAVEKVAATKARVLITGESGSGKELIARAIHRLSPRQNGPFIKVNCAAIPSELIESELFGHERGAFTGAIKSKRGHFEKAHGGTLLLDEVGDMSLSAQAKVLRVLQTGELTRVGGDSPIEVDVRVVAATNKDLPAEIAGGNFREDLYFRLNVVPLETPPLRTHPDDIPLMVEAFLDEFAAEHDLPRKQITPEALGLLKQYRWPGNVRELKNIIERLLILGHDPIEIGDLPAELLPERAAASMPFGISPGSHNLKEFRELAERTYIEATLRSNNWNVSRSAERLGVERTNLHKKIKAFGITRDES